MSKLPLQKKITESEISLGDIGGIIKVKVRYTQMGTTIELIDVCAARNEHTNYIDCLTVPARMRLIAEILEKHDFSLAADAVIHDWDAPHGA